MSHSFTKLFSSITESTVWSESHATRIVWITMLAMADRKGRVQASVPGLANRARVTLEECEHALERFMAPDRYSRTPDNDGRRIEQADGGWLLLNYAKYREMRDDEARGVYMRDYMRDRRKHEKLTVSRSKPGLAKAEAEAEAEADKGFKNPVAATPLPDWLDPKPFEAWFKIRPAKARTPEAREAAIEQLAEFRGQGHDPNAILKHSLASGYRGLFPPKAYRGNGQTLAERNKAAIEEAARRFEEEHAGR